MIKILIVEDESDKVKDIMDVIGEFSVINEQDVSFAISMNQARTYLNTYQYDLIILDIQLPNVVSKNTIRNGGITLMEEILSIESMYKPAHIIGMTYFEDVKKDFEESFNNEMWMLIHYNPESSTWKRQLKNKINYLLQWKEQYISSVRGQLLNKYDIAIVTAVDVEYDAMMNLDIDWKDIDVKGDGTNYKEGIIKGKNKDLKVVVAMQPQMGMPAAATLSMKMINNFTPKYLSMVGIAAGKNNKVKLGDILVASESWDYGSGKVKSYNNTEERKNQLFEPEPHYINMDSELIECFKKDYSDILYQIRKKWKAVKYTQDIEIHIGPFASGAAVIQDESVVKEKIDPHNRKLIGIDMEAYGLYYAAENAPMPRPKFFSIKSVCDFANNAKNDDYQAYAAFTSAQFFYYFALNNL